METLTRWPPMGTLHTSYGRAITKKSGLVPSGSMMKQAFCTDLFLKVVAAASKQHQQPPSPNNNPKAKPKPRSKPDSSVSKRKDTPPLSSLSSKSSASRTREGRARPANQVPLKAARSKVIEFDEDLEDLESTSFQQLLKPPAGFILDNEGNVVLMAPEKKRVVSMVQKETGRSLECLIRRAFLSSSGEQCFILVPLDTPLQILKIEGKGLSELTDGELEEVLPTASYALAKKRMHLVFSGFCLTARGGFCFTEDEVMDLETEYSQGLTGSLAEGVEITKFKVGSNTYLIYTPFDPVMFVTVKDEQTGEISIADDELMEDRAILDAVNEENEFQDMVEEEEAMNQALRDSQESSCQ